MTAIQNIRPFTAFAFLADKLSQGGDIVSGLIPLFTPVIAPLAGTRFEAGKLSELLAEYYGMDIHPYAIEDLAPRLYEQGLLDRKEISSHSFEYIYQKIDHALPEMQNNLVENVSKPFIKFAQDQLAFLNVRLSDETLTNALLDRLKKAEFFGALIKPNGTDKKIDILTLKPSQTAPKDENHLETRLDILVASFLLNAHENDPALYQLLIKITTGALIAEVILDFRHPTSLTDLKGITILLDTPFLMSLFDLGSKLGTSYAEKLYQQLKQVGANLATFRHSIDEFRDNMKAVLEAKKEGRAWGETAIRLTDPNFKLYATTLLPVLGDRIRQKGIEIAGDPSANLYRHFPVEEEQELIGRITFHNSIQARERDAHSIACVMRIRNGKSVSFSNFQSCDSIFLTKNGKLVKITEDLLHELSKLHEGDVPPCITDRYFAGLLWIMFGGEKGGLPEHRLLANCARAVQAGDNVISKMHEILVHSSPEQVEHFSALMTSERASQYLMQLTLGDPVLITEENHRDIYSKIEMIAGEKVAKQKDSEIALIKESHKQELEEFAHKENLGREQLIAQAKLQHDELQQAHTDSLITSSKVRETQQALDTERNLKEQQQLIIINDALVLGKKSRRVVFTYVTLVSTAAFISLNLIDKFILPDLPVGSLLAKMSMPIYLIGLVTQFVLSFWFIPDVLFGSYAQRKQKETTKRYLNKFGLADQLELYEIDWVYGKVLNRKSL